jgi:hypothetical protein
VGVGVSVGVAVGGTSVLVAVGVTGVLVEVGGTGVCVGAGVTVGPKNCPDPHPNAIKLINKISIAVIRCLVFILYPTLPRVYPAAGHVDPLALCLPGLLQRMGFTAMPELAELLDWLSSFSLITHFSNFNPGFLAIGLKKSLFNTMVRN